MMLKKNSGKVTRREKIKLRRFSEQFYFYFIRDWCITFKNEPERVYSVSIFLHKVRKYYKYYANTNTMQTME